MTTTPKQGFIERMQLELTDLKSKADALEKFIDGEAIKSLDATEQALLHAQQAAMATYEHVLGLRLSKYIK